MTKRLHGSVWKFVNTTLICFVFVIKIIRRAKSLKRDLQLVRCSLKTGLKVQNKQSAPVNVKSCRQRCRCHRSYIFRHCSALSAVDFEISISLTDFPHASANYMKDAYFKNLFSFNWIWKGFVPHISVFTIIQQEN